jgi:endonuclease YncB( thermonuclease family)
VNFRRVSFALIGALAITGFALSPNPSMAQDRRPSDVPAGELAMVKQVVDARTIIVDIAGVSKTVTLAGIDVPTGSACQASAAGASVRSLLNDRLVQLQRDAADPAENARYVFRVDGVMAQEHLLKTGFARNAPPRTDAPYANAFAILQSKAQAGQLGGWKACGWAAPAQNRSADGCLVIGVERMLARVQPLPELATAASGDCVNIVKLANASTGEWSGNFAYRPRGSVVDAGTMYVRWKDGFVLISTDADGAPQAFVVDDTYRARIFPWDRPGYQNQRPGETRVSVRKLEASDADAALLRIPDPQVNLFRRRADGKLETLVDTFVLRSGEARPARVLPSGDIE